MFITRYVQMISIKSKRQKNNKNKYDLFPTNKILLHFLYVAQENEDEQKIHIGNIITYEQSAKKHAQQITESPK